MMAVIPDYVSAVLHTLEEVGYQAYLVGGCLRDILLGRVIHDWDVATTARGADVVSLFRKTVETGARFGTVTVVTGDGHVEVTTLRSDGVYSDHRRPEVVRFVDDLQEDLKRRDFTINAMAMSSAGVLSDPFDGQGDLKRCLLRCVGKAEDRFSEDALRMFRALRFSAQLGFDIEDQTMAAIGKCAPLCAALSAERVRDETEKILMSERPEVVFSAVELGLFADRLTLPPGGVSAGGFAVFPPYNDGAPVIPDDTGRGSISVTGQTPGSFRAVAAAWDARMRWAAFCAALRRGGFIVSAQDFLRAMRLDAKAVRNVGTGAEAVIDNPFPENKAGVKRLLADIGVEAAFCAAAADEALRGGSAVRGVEEVISGGECFSLAALEVKGDELIALGIAPGTQLGTILKALLEHVIDRPEDNKREILMKIALKIM
jgi:tRNA nucleotidyltransferase (CCA-adding enzyme)